MSRAEYVWGAKQYLAGFEKREKRQYDDRYPWRSLQSIASRMGKSFGMIFKFKTDPRTGIRTITRIL